VRRFNTIHSALHTGAKSKDVLTLPSRKAVTGREGCRQGRKKYKRNERNIIVLLVCRCFVRRAVFIIIRDRLQDGGIIKDTAAVQ
jgi:hypothetical protein